MLPLFKVRQVHMGFRQTEEKSWSCREAWHAFIMGWGKPCTLQGVCSPACSCMSLHVTQQEVPISLYTTCKQSWQGAKILCDTEWFCTFGPTQCHGNIVYQTQSQGYENTAYLSSPDICVRELDRPVYPTNIKQVHTCKLINISKAFRVYWVFNNARCYFYYFN